MTYAIRGCLAALAAAVVFAVAAMPAAAVTVSPTGAYTLNWGGAAFTQTSTRSTIACNLLTLTESVTFTGAGTVAAGSLPATLCSAPAPMTVTVDQPLAWTTSIALAAGPTLSINVTIPAGGIRFSVVGSACRWTASGSVSFSRGFAALPATVGATVFGPAPGVAVGLLTTNSVTSCSPLIATVGLTMNAFGTLTHSGSMVVS
jgi:hypothetical protein